MGPKLGSIADGEPMTVPNRERLKSVVEVVISPASLRSFPIKGLARRPTSLHPQLKSEPHALLECGDAAPTLGI